MPDKTYSNYNLKDIDVIILAGGGGNRLRKLINDRPKPMAEVNQHPFLDILIEYVSNYGPRRFILATGYLAEVVEEYYKNKIKDISQEILFSREIKPLGTGGAIKKAEKLIQSNPFLVLNGDSFCPVNLSKFLNFHLDKEALASIVLTKAKNSGDCGTISLGNLQRITQFQEKRASVKKSYINTGIYLFTKDVLSLIPAQRNFSLEYELFPKLVGKNFYGYFSKEKLIDIGTPERYLKAKRFFLHKKK